MDSSFLTDTALTVLNVGLGLFTAVMFIKLLLQFGLPNHPARFTVYLVSLCAAFFFVTRAATDLGQVSPFFWMRWRTLPLVAGGVTLLLQSIMIVGQLGILQQKVISRIPLIASLLCFAFFPTWAEFFFGSSLLVAAVFLSVSVGKGRMQKRAFLKMCLMMGLYALIQLPQQIWLHVAGQLFLYGALFYFFLFEQTIGVRSLIDQALSEEGVRA